MSSRISIADEMNRDQGAMSDKDASRAADDAMPRLSRRGLGAAAGGLAAALGFGGRIAAPGVAAPPDGPSGPAGSVRFPDGFLWGTSSSAESVEGAITEDGRGPSIWDTFSHTPGKTVNGDTGDVACDEYRRYEQHFDLMATLGLRAYRFSISWSRIMPTGAEPINPAGLDHYQRVVDALLARGISPVITIYHWDLPQALQDSGGWTARDTAERYADFAATVYETLGDRVPYFLCLNEPNSQALLGYGTGQIAPGIADPHAIFPAAHHQLLGQGLAVRAMRAVNHPAALIGTTINIIDVHPASGSSADMAAANLFDGIWNRTYLAPIFKGAYPEDVLDYYGKLGDTAEVIEANDLATISSPLDFLGVNYYTSNAVAADAKPPGYRIVPPVSSSGLGSSGPDITAMGWRVAPQGLISVLRRVRDDYTRIPLYLTETGVAYHDYVDPSGEIRDGDRIAFLDAYLRAAHDAIADGVDLRGLIVWCFQDNFASTNGYSIKFGLAWTDFVSQQVIPKQSAAWYRDVIARNGLAPRS
ncbi:GH1 family beta-glucosidase [Nocardia sp. NPDC052112]|uniref:GH1 family beta-glucosidase n=1 Tax=Nocardia sp. NPDC052112 TaxID=3155646 RepID=UPI0034432E48